MSPSGSKNSDIQKIHAEINQIVNQRFLIVTVAITAFGVITTWLIPRNTPPSGANISALTAFGSIVLTSLLFMLFMFSYFLTRMLRIFTTYLLVTKESGWEDDWKKYREMGYFGYTKAQTLVFLFLIGLSTFLPLILEVLYSTKPKCSTVLLLDFLIGALYLVFVVAIGFLHCWDPEVKAKTRWEKLKRS